MKIFFLVLWGITVSAFPAFSQTATKKLSDFPPPSPPLISSPAETARWTITAQKKAGEEAPKGARISNIESVKTGSLKQDIITSASGEKTEVWYYQNYVLFTLPGNPGRVIIQEQTALDDSPQAKGAFRDLGNALRSTGFPGFKWLDLRHYEGLTFFDKTIPCYHYVLHGKDHDSGADLTIAEAWINATNGAPVAYSAEGDLFVYHFEEPPRESLILPAQFSAAYNKLRQSLDRQKRLEADAAAAR